MAIGTAVVAGVSLVVCGAGKDVAQKLNFAGPPSGNKTDGDSTSNPGSRANEAWTSCALAPITCLTDEWTECNEKKMDFKAQKMKQAEKSMVAETTSALVKLHEGVLEGAAAIRSSTEQYEELHGGPAPRRELDDAIDSNSKLHLGIIEAIEQGREHYEFLHPKMAEWDPSYLYRKRDGDLREIVKRHIIDVENALPSPSSASGEYPDCASYDVAVNGLKMVGLTDSDVESRINLFKNQVGGSFSEKVNGWILEDADAQQLYASQKKKYSVEKYNEDSLMKRVSDLAKKEFENNWVKNNLDKYARFQEVAKQLQSSDENIKSST